MIDDSQIRTAYETARSALLAERTTAGYWVGELSTSALSTAVAVIALHRVQAQEHQERIRNGLNWLAEHQNPDGGFGDTVRSVSNISTAMLVRSAYAIAGPPHPTSLDRLETYLRTHCGKSAAERAEAIRQRYGTDRTFSVPILMTAALAGLVPWREVPRLPYEFACLPQSWYRFVGLPVVSYALPALIAIGQAIEHFRPSWNPLRSVTKSASLRVLRRIQPSSGGYLEATPLTAFVTMSLASIRPSQSRRVQTTIDEIVHDAVKFLLRSVRPDGSWPIDTNLSIWVTTLSVNALAAAGDLTSLDRRAELTQWLLDQQTRERHPYTGAAPGAWGWSDEPGSVPDCDDTPGALLALRHLLGEQAFPHLEAAVQQICGPIPFHELEFGDVSDRFKSDRLGLLALAQGVRWMMNLQNRDGGIPTFCRGWGKLPFDRSGCDLTAHALRAAQAWQAPDDAIALRTWNIISGALGQGVSFPSRQQHRRFVERAMGYLANQQRADGSWLPLWFGNQHAPDDINPVYGTARVLAAYRDLKLTDSPACQRGVQFLLQVQNADGGWGGAAGCPSSVEETAVVVEVLVDLTTDAAVSRGVAWLIAAVESGRFREPSPIGFYFAKLWYFEKLYPIIFTVAALGRAARARMTPA